MTYTLKLWTEVSVVTKHNRISFLFQNHGAATSASVTTIITSSSFLTSALLSTLYLSLALGTLFSPAAMSNWDDDDWEADTGRGLPTYPHAAPPDNWDDEDESDDETHVTNLKKPSAPMKPSKQRALALKLKEEEESQKAAERVRALEQKMQEMSAIERKIEQQRIVEEADLQNAKDMFMDSDAKDAIAPPAQPTLDDFKPVTDADVKKFADMLGERCRALNDNPRKTTRYVTFLKDLIRGVTADLGPDDAKDLSTFMGIVSNEKRDEFKKSKGFKKKVNKKANVRVDRAADMRDDRYDDFVDDFM